VTIAGIAMDIHYEEPTSGEDPAFRFANSIFSHHVAGSTRDAYATPRLSMRVCQTSLTSRPILSHLVECTNPKKSA